MGAISCSHFLLGIMVPLLALKACDAYANRGIKKVVFEAGVGVTVPAGEDMHNGKEIFVPITAEDTNGILGGRKMMMKKRKLTNEVKKEEIKKTSEETSKISGRKDIAKSLKKTPEDYQKHSDDQNDRSQLKGNQKNDANSETSVQKPNDLPNSTRLCSKECAADSTNCSLKCSSGSKSSVSKMSDQDSFQKLDSEKLLKAARQIVNLMNKDYPGGGGPRHKPPINNREPLH